VEEKEFDDDGGSDDVLPTDLQQSKDYFSRSSERWRWKEVVVC